MAAHDRHRESRRQLRPEAVATALFGAVVAFVVVAPFARRAAALHLSELAALALVLALGLGFRWRRRRRTKRTESVGPTVDFPSGPRRVPLADAGFDFSP